MVAKTYGHSSRRGPIQLATGIECNLGLTVSLLLAESARRLKQQRKVSGRRSLSCGRHFRCRAVEVQHWTFSNSLLDGASMFVSFSGGRMTKRPATVPMHFGVLRTISRSSNVGTGI